MSDVKKGRVLAIAGSDSGGGAGIQADIKTITALGGYAMTAITAVTIQNTLGVFGIHPIPPDVVRDQIEKVLGDLGADALKIGMLGDAETVEVVAQAIEHSYVPLVLDPVMIAKGGAALLEDDAVEALKRSLLPQAFLVTPNAPEAERLTGMPVRNLEEQKRAAEALVKLGAGAALVKGGHLYGATLNDVLASASGVEEFSSERINTRATHGTGCTLASAIATGVARGAKLRDAVVAARAYLRGVIMTAQGFGAGHAPLNHGWVIKS
ncbi:MAG TPA: bifunctional hydroxymethylpyrimidine kinase/phosphomethylpyrimidine kinase [Caulobacterales bacterium]|nr:bifunctional hydroxymethylpyrimidine kinase/phosphomethylpyrimidine kinase [Caulobacterales bacterium]